MQLSVKSKIANARFRLTNSATARRIKNTFRQTDYFRKRRNTAVGKKIYRIALRFRGRMKLDPFETLFPLDKELTRIEELLERSKKEKSREKMNKIAIEMKNVFDEMKQAIFHKSIRRAMIVAGVKPEQRKTIWSIAKQIEAEALRPAVENRNIRNRIVFWKRLRKELGTKYPLFASTQVKAFNEGSQILREYIDEKWSIFEKTGRAR
jgi:hypothetical protein